MALFANIETTTDSACIMLVMTDTASQARVFLAYVNNTQLYGHCLPGSFQYGKRTIIDKVDKPVTVIINQAS